MGKSPLSLLLFFLLTLTHLPCSLSWKKEEFRTCDQTPFCKKARAKSPHSSPFSLSGVTLINGHLSAALLQSNKTLILDLSVYEDGILRLTIDEPEKTRFRVPDVIIPEFDQKKVDLNEIRTSPDGLSSVIGLADGVTAVLRHDPFSLSVVSGDDVVLSFNAHGLFDFETRRNRTEGEEFEERFRGHTDSRPRGPESISFDLSFYDADFVYGIPEHASTSLGLKFTRGPGVENSEPYRLFNLDVFEYLHESPFGLYGSVPFMISHGRRGSSGFFWLNAAEMQVDVLAPGWDEESSKEVKKKKKKIDTLWMSEAGILDGFFFIGPRPKDVIRQYTRVTGAPALPQLFAIAYHQCRWNYRDEDDVRNVDAGFDEHDIPYDVLWLDIEHTDGKRYFTWDKALFPNPVEMQKRISDKGRRMVTIVDPHIKRDESFGLHLEATEKGFYVKDSSGKDFDGWCWPGSSSYPDMLDPEIREWWAKKFSLNDYVGSTPSLYIWNDMNEPSVFNGPEVTMPRDALHYGGVEHREVHNAYGYYFHMASTEGLLKRGGGNDRPFVLSRAFFAGTQRYGAIWTGDNTADWDHFKASVPMVLTLGLAGLTFSGADVGGFFGNPEPELLVRWYQLGAYYPFFRGHAHHDTKRREPWLFGARNTARIREAIHLRYSLLPYYYTLFREASISGTPVMRPLWLEFPDDPLTFNVGDAFLVGDGLLVKGIYERQKSVGVYLPGKENWFDIRSGVAYAGGRSHQLEASDDGVPAFQRAGTIIPRRERFRRSSTQMANDPFTLVVALNSSMEAEGELYLDDGRSFDYADGAFIHRRFIFANQTLHSFTMPVDHHGIKVFSSDCVVERVVILGLPVKPQKATIWPAGGEAEVEPGPLTLRPRARQAAVVVRRPNLRIADDWSLKLL